MLSNTPTTAPDFLVEAVRLWLQATNADKEASDSDQGKARNLVGYAMEFLNEGRTPDGDMQRDMQELQTALAADRPSTPWAPVEFPACAAIRLPGGHIVAGRRHADCLRACMEIGLPKPGSESQGFMTTSGRWVCREEAFLLAHKAGMESVAEGGYRGKQLFSEDLY